MSDEEFEHEPQEQTETKPVLQLDKKAEQGFISFFRSLPKV